MRRGTIGWLLRGLAVIAVTAIIALWVLVHPLHEPSHPAFTPTGTATATVAPTVRPTQTPPPPTLTPPASPIEEHPAATITSTASVELVGRVEEQVYFSLTTGAEEPYRIYLPPGYDEATRRYPVLYLLHGWPYEAAHWGALGVEETVNAGIQSGALPLCIIVQPQGSERMYVNTSGGDQSFEGQIINDLIPHVDATYRTWAEREGRAIGGISRGGVWSLEIGFSHPDVFAAVGAHSPALSVNMAPPAHDPFYLLEEPEVAALRIYLDAGDADWSREYTQKLHEALAAHNVASEFVVHPGGHATGLWSANVNEYLDFYTAGWHQSPQTEN